MRDILRSPFWWTAIGAVGTIAPMAIPSGAGWPLSIAAMTLYSIAAPLACALGTQWWLKTLLTGAAWVAIFFAVGEMPGLKAIKELAMVFLLPMMVYPLAVGVSGLIRLARWREARTRARTTSVPTSDWPASSSPSP